MGLVALLLIFSLALTRRPTYSAGFLPIRSGFTLGLRDKRGVASEEHHGVDVFAPTGTPVYATGTGYVIRVEDGRKDPIGSGRRRAGLWVDVRMLDTGYIHRYLHLGSTESYVKPGLRVTPDTLIGKVAEAGTSGTGEAPHVHFEIRASDWDDKKRSYGTPINPVQMVA